MLDANIRNAWWRWFGLSAIVIVLDQLTKHAIQSRFQTGESYAGAPFFNLVLVYNEGAAFSFLAGAGGWQRWFFVALSVAVSAALVWMLRSNTHNRLLSIALALVLGGAIGNLIDRVT